MVFFTGLLQQGYLEGCDKICHEGISITIRNKNKSYLEIFSIIFQEIQFNFFCLKTTNVFVKNLTNVSVKNPTNVSVKNLTNVFEIFFYF